MGNTRLLWTSGQRTRSGASNRASARARVWAESLHANRAIGERGVVRRRERGVVRRMGEGGRFVPGLAVRRCARITVISTLIAFAVWLVTAASASAFTAQGSAQQVYVSGLGPNAQMSLLNSSGATVQTQNADSLGGLLFRNVAPGTGYQVRLTSTGEASGPITVHSDAAAPWDPSFYKQSIPDNGYTYLTTRDGTQLAIDVHRRPARRASQAFRRHFTFRPSRRREATHRRIRRISSTPATGMRIPPVRKMASRCSPT